MASTESSNRIDHQDNEAVPPPSQLSSEDVISNDKTDEPTVVSESEETEPITDQTTDEIPDIDVTPGNTIPTNMVTAEASFSEATAADLPLATPRSSIARILVKPGQIFRVQVDNEVKEVHGEFSSR